MKRSMGIEIYNMHLWEEGWEVRTFGTFDKKLAEMDKLYNSIEQLQKIDAADRYYGVLCNKEDNLTENDVKGLLTTKVSEGEFFTKEYIDGEAQRRHKLQSFRRQSYDCWR